jgi:hypothetical protein
MLWFSLPRKAEASSDEKADGPWYLWIIGWTMHVNLGQNARESVLINQIHVSEQPLSDAPGPPNPASKLRLGSVPMQTSEFY